MNHSNDPSHHSFFSNSTTTTTTSGSTNNNNQQGSNKTSSQSFSENINFYPEQQSYRSTTGSTNSIHSPPASERSDLLIDPIVGQNIINNTISKFLQFNNLSKQQDNFTTMSNNFNNALNNQMNNPSNQQLSPSFLQSLQRSTFQPQQQQQQQQQQQSYNTPSPSSTPFPVLSNTQQPFPQSSPQTPFNFTPIGNPSNSNRSSTGIASNQSSVNLLASILANQNFSLPQQQQQNPNSQTPVSNNQQTQHLIAKIQSLESEIQSLKQDNQRVKNDLSDFATSFLEFKNNFLGRNTSGLGVIITSGDTGKILSANSCVLKLLGYEDLAHFQSCVSKWSDVVVQEDRQRVFSTFLQSALASNDNCFIVFRAKRFDGKIINVSSNHVVAYDDGGENPFFSMSFFKQIDTPPEDLLSEQQSN